MFIKGTERTRKQQNDEEQSGTLHVFVNTIFLSCLSVWIFFCPGFGAAVIERSLCRSRCHIDDPKQLVKDREDARQNSFSSNSDFDKSAEWRIVRSRKGFHFKQKRLKGKKEVWENIKRHENNSNHNQTHVRKADNAIEIHEIPKKEDFPLFRGLHGNIEKRCHRSAG